MDALILCLVAKDLALIKCIQNAFVTRFIGNFKEICFLKSNKSFPCNISILFFHIKESG